MNKFTTTLKALFLALAFTSTAFAQDTAYVPFKTNVNASIKAQQGAKIVTMATTAGVTDSLLIVLPNPLAIGPGKVPLKPVTMHNYRGRISLELSSQFAKNTEISLYSLNGKRVMHGISRQNVARGVYLLHVKGDGKTFATRIAHSGGEMSIDVAFREAEPLKKETVTLDEANFGDWDIVVSAEGYFDSAYVLTPVKGNNPLNDITLHTPAEMLIAKWYTSPDPEALAGSPRYEFTDSGEMFYWNFIGEKMDQYDYTYTVENNTITLNYISYGLPTTETASFAFYNGSILKIYNADGGNTFLENGYYYKGAIPQTIMGVGDLDFAAGDMVTIFNVRNADEWEVARLHANGNTIINIIGDVTVPGNRTYITGGGNGNLKTFWGGEKISIRGTGTLALSNEDGEKGNLLYLEDQISDHTVIVRDLTLRGRSDNDDALIKVSIGATLITYNAKITGNSNIETDPDYSNGGGVYMAGGDFIMNGGEISGNSAINGSGGGVYGGLIMNGGEIRGNKAANGGGVSGLLQISNGKIYGIYDPINDRNTATGEGAALNGIALLGTYADGVFTSNDKTIDTDNTLIWVVNGVRIYSDIGNAPQALLDNTWYTSQENANERTGDYLEFDEVGRVLRNGVYEGLVFTVSGTTLTVMNPATQSSESRTFSLAGFELTLSGSGTLLAGNSYFMPDPAAPIKIRTVSDWNSIIAIINKVGKGDFILNIMDNISVATTSITAAEGKTLEITIKGIEDLRAVNIVNGYLSIGSGVTVTLAENLALQGGGNSGYPKVYNSGTIIMNAGCSISNTNSASCAEACSGTSVGVSNGGTFIMNGGTISVSASANSTNNHAYANGYGVYNENNGTFIMNGGTISGSATARVTYTGSAWATGYGVSNSGTFRIITGTIYGTASATHANIPSNIIITRAGIDGTATYGTEASGGTSGGSLSSSNATINVVDGVLQ